MLVLWTLQVYKLKNSNTFKLLLYNTFLVVPSVQNNCVAKGVEILYAFIILLTSDAAVVYIPDVGHVTLTSCASNV